MRNYFFISIILISLIDYSCSNADEKKNLSLGTDSLLVSSQNSIVLISQYLPIGEWTIVDTVHITSSKPGYNSEEEKDEASSFLSTSVIIGTTSYKDLEKECDSISISLKKETIWEYLFTSSTWAYAPSSFDMNKDTITVFELKCLEVIKNKKVLSYFGNILLIKNEYYLDVANYWLKLKLPSSTKENSAQGVLPQK